MAEIGNCYGSEYHLMRFLGHHRKELENKIRENTPFKDSFEWLDFLYDKNSLSFDAEYKGIDFLNATPGYNEIKKEWEKYWPQAGNVQNWDAIFRMQNNYVLIEAKAHIEEMKQTCKAKSKESRSKIALAFNQTRKFFNITTETDWFNNYYQLANRLSFVNFMHQCGVNASILNIYFINGFEFRKIINKSITVLENKSKSVKSEEEWKKAINEEYKHLGILNTNAEKYIHSIFIDSVQ